eukprot:5732218-Prymnesium_polylepis.2
MLGARVLDNLSVVVSKVHIRYEDDFQNPERPFAVGATVSEFRWQTTDSEWNVQPHKGGPVFKICDVRTLSLYWNSEPGKNEWCGSRPDAEIQSMLAAVLSEDAAPTPSDAVDDGEGAPAH